MVKYEALSIPTLPLVGPVNAYLIKNDPVTLIDCGLDIPEARAALTEQLAVRGMGWENIKRIIITHAHSDHFGMAAEIQRISGAAVYMHNKEITKTRYRLRYLEHVISYMAYAGTPEAQCQEQRDYFASEFVRPPEEITGIEDGHIFTFDGFKLKAILTPGHSAGHLCLYQEEEGLLFSGDTVLAKVRPKPLLEPLPEQPFQREKGLVQYINSLNSLKKLNIKQILPGHGKIISDVAAVLEHADEAFRIRKEEVCGIAARIKVFNPFDLMSEMYSDFRGPLDVTMALSEVLGYLDVLEAEGKVTQQETNLSLSYTYRSYI